jgi:hypothetical protein
MMLDSIELVAACWTGNNLHMPAVKACLFLGQAGQKQTTAYRRKLLVDNFLYSIIAQPSCRALIGSTCISVLAAQQVSQQHHL